MRRRHAFHVYSARGRRKRISRSTATTVGPGGCPRGWSFLGGPSSSSSSPLAGRCHAPIAASGARRQGRAQDMWPSRPQHAREPQKWPSPWIAIAEALPPPPLEGTLGQKPWDLERARVAPSARGVAEPAKALREPTKRVHVNRGYLPASSSSTSGCSRMLLIEVRQRLQLESRR